MAAYVADVLLAANHLPERIATHFGLDGQANGWMTRTAHVRFMLGFGLGLPLFMLALSAIITRLGGAGLNIPNRDYWLAPERRAQTLAFAQRKMVWFASLLVGFFAIINHLTVSANTRAPAALSGTEMWLPIALIFVAIGIWAALLIRPFRRTT
jgi:uncharacterized membrane protein